MPTSERSRLLAEAVTAYRKAMPGSIAEEYLTSRGLPPEIVSPYRLGYVAEPQPGHEQYKGMLAIPYMRKHPTAGWSILSLRFRNLTGQGAKYLTMPGDKPHLFNTLALGASAGTIAIAEGELDTITLCAAGVPTVGVPGASSWQDHWTLLFEGYSQVLVFCDGDEAGHGMGSRVADLLPAARVFTLPPGEDANSLHQNNQLAPFLEKICSLSTCPVPTESQAPGSNTRSQSTLTLVK